MPKQEKHIQVTITDKKITVNADNIGKDNLEQEIADALKAVCDKMVHDKAMEIYQNEIIYRK